MSDSETVKQWISELGEDQRREAFRILRREFPIHPLEAQLNTRAEVILEAISRASDLVQRGVRGVIAEAAFEIDVASDLGGWRCYSVFGDRPYDFMLEDSTGQVRVQVKMQRQKEHRPMLASEALRWLPADMFVVETQRTRAGRDPRTGESTRPYRFGEFDILAVSLHPSTGRWDSFLFTVADWLLAAPADKRKMLKFQPVAMRSDLDRWTDDFDTCVQWFRSGEKRALLPGLE